MVSQNNAQMSNISDDELIQVSGGSQSLLDAQGQEVKEGRFITSTFSSYSSGSTPKFNLGDSVKIKWRVSNDLKILCNAEITGVSEGKDGGLLFQKYTYSIKILSCPNSDMIGRIETDVHENCLYF